MGLLQHPVAAIATIVLVSLVSVSPSLAQSNSQTPNAQTEETTEPLVDRRDRSGLAVGGAALRYGDTGDRLDVVLEVAAEAGSGASAGVGLPGWLRECIGGTWTYFEQEAYFARLMGMTLTEDTFEPMGDRKADDLWSYLECPNSDEALAASPILQGTGIFGVWPQGDEPPQIVQDLIVARSLASLQIPHPSGQGAPMGTVDIPLITQLPTWLWIDETTWQPHSVTPPPLFGITATATATPINVTFTGDNEFVDCGPNLGPPYNFNLKENQQHSDCTLTYRHSSNVGNYTLTNTITWQITWACNQYCGTGTIGNRAITTYRDVTVAELQAILVG